jgi:hypothetical protein
VDQGVEESCAVPFAQDQAFMPQDGRPGGLCECRKAKLCQAAPFQRRRALYLTLGFRIHTKTQAVGSCAAFGGLCDG